MTIRGLELDLFYLFLARSTPRSKISENDDVFYERPHNFMKGLIFCFYGKEMSTMQILFKIECWRETTVIMKNALFLACMLPHTQWLQKTLSLIIFKSVFNLERPKSWKSLKQITRLWEEIMFHFDYFLSVWGTETGKTLIAQKSY